MQQSFIRHKHVQVVPENVECDSNLLLAPWQRKADFKNRQDHVLTQTALMQAETWALPLDLSPLDRLHENCPGHLGKSLIFISLSLSLSLAPLSQPPSAGDTLTFVLSFPSSTKHPRHYGTYITFLAHQQKPDIQHICFLSSTI